MMAKWLRVFVIITAPLWKDCLCIIIRHGHFRYRFSLVRVFWVSDSSGRGLEDPFTIGPIFGSVRFGSVRFGSDNKTRNRKITRKIGSHLVLVRVVLVIQINYWLFRIKYQIIRILIKLSEYFQIVSDTFG